MTSSEAWLPAPSSAADLGDSPQLGAQFSALYSREPQGEGLGCKQDDS